jgi:hypothetical protein
VVYGDAPIGLSHKQNSKAQGAIQRVQSFHTIKEVKPDLSFLKLDEFKEADEIYDIAKDSSENTVSQNPSE